ncbi:MAG: hypothetical protein ACE1ZQ_08510 [Ignavibacteriaceae bacterium]
MNKREINKYISINTKILQEYIDFKIALANYLLGIDKNEDWWKNFEENRRIIFKVWALEERFIEPICKDSSMCDSTQIKNTHTLPLKAYGEYLVLLKDCYEE